MTERRVFCDATNDLVLLYEQKEVIFLALTLLARSCQGKKFTASEILLYSNRCLDVAKSLSDQKVWIRKQTKEVVELLGGILRPVTVWDHLKQVVSTKPLRILVSELALFLLTFSPKYHTIDPKKFESMVTSVARKVLFKEELTEDEVNLVRDVNDSRQYASGQAKEKFAFLLKTVPRHEGVGISPEDFFFPPSTQVHELGEKVKTLGRGASGKVVLVKIGTKTLAQKRQAVTQESLQEISILSSYSHENVISLDSFSLILGLELNLEVGVALSDLVDTHRDKEVWSRVYLEGAFPPQVFSKEQKRKYQQDVCRGMRYLHEQKVLYRDPKFANVIIINGTAKLSDFGLSLEQADSVEHKIVDVYTFSYRPPEILYYERNNYSFPADVWATGAVLLEIETEVLAFPHDHEDNPKNSVLESIFSILDTNFSFLDEDVRPLISSMLVWEPSRRKTFQEI
jgi:serine/threonine protein kinase